MDNYQESVPKTRIIKLDLEMFPKWVEEESDKTLIEVFRLGVAVRDSVKMTFSGTPKYVDEVLETKFEPVCQKVQKMVETISQQTEILYQLKPEMQSQIRDSQLQIQEKIDKIAILHQKPTTKGAIGEKTVLSILKQGLPQYGFKDVSSKGRQGDIHVHSVYGHRYLIEVKNCQGPVGTAEIEKFEKNVRENADFKVGILFSLKSGILMRALQSKFEIGFIKDQYSIYVPNALAEENLIIWSVLLADELANLQQGLNDTQVEAIEGLYHEFQKNIERSKKCRGTLNTLKRTVRDMEENLVPLLDIIDKAKNDLNRVLHQKRSSRSKERESTSQMRQDDIVDETKYKSGKRSRTKSPVSPSCQTFIELEHVKMEENEENMHRTNKQSPDAAEKSPDNAGSNTLSTSPSFSECPVPCVTIDDD